ncbi:hypothetical protein [Chitinimonas taiwanensis]|uniref:Uncharacterized protein n=1 Tax=Chitinimonas taiwanensis DSM 18899 TaxID=1121279 RepID=A0A1K2H6Q4_9NEIS|nr:hypothetical protein [Chitinimonas taiwanensis]SFZ72036.1 hypothetical protein SAMN02745887_00518 [Chitinimonas taiwanensis DSM 18899]
MLSTGHTHIAVRLGYQTKQLSLMLPERVQTVGPVAMKRLNCLLKPTYDSGTAWLALAYKLDPKRALALKRILALIIAACFFLPLGQCSSKEPTDDNLQDNTQDYVFTPIEAIDLRDHESALLILIFSWPLLLTTCESSTKKAIRRAHHFMELISSILSLYLLKGLFSIYSLIFLSGYALLSALLLFTLITSVEILNDFSKSKG